MEKQKTCCSCRILKAAKDFHKNPYHLDGLHSSCKECRATYSKELRKKNSEDLRKYHAAKAREYRGKGEGNTKKSVKEWKNKNPEKVKAKDLLNAAIRYGRMNRKDSCERCGSINSIQAHHEDYNKPLKVMWLCAVCHKARHAELKKTGGEK